METIVFPEMLVAGEEVLNETEGLHPKDRALQVYLAMEAIRMIALMRDQAGVVH